MAARVLHRLLVTLAVLLVAAQRVESGLLAMFF
jgi:hypothetical protein